MDKKELTLEEVKQLQLDILQVVHNFCESNGICYSLAYGTLIGAIRHKGYIPWDDDIDIMMPRPDYERFLRTFDGYHPDLSIQDVYKDESYYYTFAKVYNNKTKYIMFGYEGGVYIDIFPIDGLPNKESLHEFLQQKKKLASDLWRTAKTYKYEEENKILVFLKYCVKRIIFPSRKKMLAEMREFAQRWSFSNHPLASTDNNSGKLILPKEYFTETIMLSFEKYEFCCIKEYDAFLKLVYGDYMTPPPENQRIPPHNNHIYWK